MKKKLFYTICFAVLLLMAACTKKEEPAPTPTPSPVPTSTPAPTATPSPTPTPTPLPENLALTALKDMSNALDFLANYTPGTAVDYSKGVGYDMTMELSLGAMLKQQPDLAEFKSLSMKGYFDIKEMLAANDSGLSYKGGTMYWPSKQCTILTSTYGWRWGSLHKGIDLACYGNATGKDIRAAADGTVIAVNNTSEWGYGWCSGYGYCVMVDHGYDKKGRRVTTLYAHMSKVLVSVGQQVKGGSTQLGKVGNTGNSFGAHLHFEVRLDGTAVDPIGNGYVKVP